MAVPAEDIMAEKTEPAQAAPKGSTPASRIRIENHTFVGSFWCAAWLFTIGYLHLSFWKGFFAILLWPYYIGRHVSAILH